MKITDVKVNKLKDKENKLKGVATIVINDLLAIHDIRIIEGDNGLFIAMPSRKTAIGEYKDIVHPINKETRDLFTTAIIEEYSKTE